MLEVFFMFHCVVPNFQWDKIVINQWETFESLAESRYSFFVGP